MKFKITIILFATFFTSGLCQQVEFVRFNEILHDFESVKEEDGDIEHEFQFTNVSPDSVKITRVQASCGCTTPNWSREKVPPGGTGFIQARYNPLNRPGAFNKYLTVSVDKQSTPIRLIIKGNVVPKVKSIEEELPSQLGNIRVKYKSFNMGNIYTVDVPTTKVYDVYNAGDAAVTFLDSMSVPSYITVAVNPKTLKPSEKGEIAISYDAKSRNDLGFVNDNVTLF
ncbi:MAG: DUF1573 domain-containing protein, partial [Cyclobacteriaceae bacterium]|nr:DUF1573 domain-containing protein [Cyclobacteriaceae bacterium]